MRRPLRRAFLSGLTFLSALALSVATAQAAPIGLVDIPGAPLLPTVAGPVIFDLTGNNGVVQFGQVIPAFGGIPNTAAVSANPGGACVGFVTGELCGTNEPGPVGFRAWEVILANTNGPAVESFFAGFFAPGLSAIYAVTIVNGGGIYFPFNYFGPTAPLFGVFSTVPFPVTIATTIVDPPISSAIFTIGPEGSSAVLCPTCIPNFGIQAAVPEPATLTLLGLGLVGIAQVRSRRKRARATQQARGHARPEGLEG